MELVGNSATTLDKEVRSAELVDAAEVSEATLEDTADNLSVKDVTPEDVAVASDVMLAAALDRPSDAEATDDVKESIAGALKLSTWMDLKELLPVNLLSAVIVARLSVPESKLSSFDT